MTTEKRLITIEDLNRIQMIEDVQISPDGHTIAYVVSTPARIEKGYTRNIWVVDSQGGAPRQLTRGGKDGQPRWSPDSQHLAFVSARNGTPQIYLCHIGQGGDPRPLTSHEGGANSPAWSPDGAHMAYLSRLSATERQREDEGATEAPPRDEVEARHRKERKTEDRKQVFDPLWVDRIPYRVGTAYLDDRHAQVYVIPTSPDVEGDAARPRRITSADCDHNQPEWSADGQYLYTLRTEDPLGDEPWRSSNIYRVRVADGDLTCLADEMTVFAQKPSPDGRWLAAIRIPRDSTETIGQLALVPTDGTGPIALNATLDREVSQFNWTPEGHLIASVQDQGRISLYRFDPSQPGHTLLLEGDAQVRGFSVGARGVVAFNQADTANPSDLFVFRPGDASPTRITRINEKFLEEIAIQPVHEIWFESEPGVRVHGWYLLPPGYTADQPTPLLVNIHGGPHVMWGPADAAMFHEWQVQAAQGYAVFACNPRGSDGYGQAHISALHAAWGEVAQVDILAGIEAVQAQVSIDPARIVVTGGSYGGYMTAWLISHDDRFRAAVSQRGVYNLLSFYGTSDIPRFITNEFGVSPWEDSQFLWQKSPLAYAHQIRTPLLIIHSENDFRVPIEQGEQLFAYVRRTGGTVRLLRFPREGHELSRSGEPDHRVQRMTAMMDWFNQACFPAEPDADEPLSPE